MVAGGNTYYADLTRDIFYTHNAFVFVIKNCALIINYNNIYIGQGSSGSVHAVFNERLEGNERLSYAQRSVLFGKKKLFVYRYDLFCYRRVFSVNMIYDS